MRLDAEIMSVMVFPDKATITVERDFDRLTVQFPVDFSREFLEQILEEMREINDRS